MINVIVEIFDWLYASGFKRLIIVNGHVGNAAPLRCALEIIRSRYDDVLIRICNVAEISPRVRAEGLLTGEQKGRKQMDVNSISSSSSIYSIDVSLKAQSPTSVTGSDAAPADGAGGGGPAAGGL